LTRREAGAVLGVLGILVAVTVPELGSDAWPFKVPAGQVNPQGPFGVLVRAADRDWDVALLRSAALAAGLAVALGAAVILATRVVRAWLVYAACAVVVGLLVLPATFLQIGLRDSTEPWYHVNDSTYQIEIGATSSSTGTIRTATTIGAPGWRGGTRRLEPARTSLRSRSTISPTSPARC